MALRKGARAMRTKMIVAGLCVLALGTMALAADFPQRPIRMIVPWSPGGGSDVLCRAFQPAFEKELGQRLLIENIPGGATKIGTMEMMKAKPDGYTLLFSNEAWISRYYAKTYDTKVWEQITPVGNVTSEPLAFVEVRAESPFKTWDDLVKAAKENPGKLSCGNSGTGSPLDIVFKEITQKTGIEVQYVPFAGAGKSKIAMLGGHTDFRLCQPPEAIANIRAGLSRGLAVSTDKRMKELPDVPTFKELGLKGGDAYYIIRGVWGPPNMPADVLSTLTKMIERATKDPEFIKIAQDEFLYQVDYRPPEDVKNFVLKFDKEFGPQLAEIFK
jgi:tripartite-type tricarboxylate transporter receptor subunit TctC